jgi:hypothetical protein
MEVLQHLFRRESVMDVEPGCRFGTSRFCRVGKKCVAAVPRGSPRYSVQSRVINVMNIPNDVHIVQHHFGVHVLIFRCRSWRLNELSRYRLLVFSLSRFSAHTGDINFLVFNA